MMRVPDSAPSILQRDGHADLSYRERGVVACLVAGYTPAEAAEQLTVELSTVRSHIKHSREKSDARNIVELVLWGVAHRDCCVVGGTVVMPRGRARDVR